MKLFTKTLRIPNTTINNIEVETQDCLSHLKIHFLCKALLFCNGLKLISKEKRFSSGNYDAIGQLLGYEEDYFDELSSEKSYKILKNKAQDITSKTISREGSLFENLHKISKYFALNSVEIELLLFAALLELDSDYGNCYDLFGEFSNQKVIVFLSKALAIPEKELREALDKNGTLSQSGILKLDSNSSHTIDRKFDFLNGFSSALEIPQKNIASLFDNYIRLSPKSLLTPDHFKHINTDYLRLSHYTKEVCKQGLIGANILIYGPPGTGKTEWVRCLLEELNLKLYEVGINDSNGNPLSGKARISACQLSQKLLEKTQGQCLLFDEIEDIFEENPFANFFSSSTPRKTNKAWVNQLLETNAVPTFWISNNIQGIDSAYLRRFDLIFELDVPPHSVRKRMLSESLENVSVSEQWLERMASLENLPPAIIQRAVKASQLTGNKDIEKNLERIISNTLKAMGHEYKTTQPILTGFYNPDIINTTAPLKKITQGLASIKSGRLCFFGPSGTGKSAYAHFLAQHLEIPIIAKRASDIIDCYVGNTEKNIAAMFAQASNENSILLLDEADSFLTDREASQHRWETTQVNELLVQMENFNGIFICSTNLMANLDAAAMRRFDVKLEFSYLKPDQAWQLLKNHLEHCFLTLEPKQEKIFEKALAKLSFLTPGDFASVRKKLTILNELDNIELFITFLKEEVNFKKENLTRPIGFTASI